jgi:hypothetical protein
MIMRKNFPLPSRDESNTRTAAYESLLDLFTLITFVLIIAAYIYASQLFGKGQNWSSVMTEAAEHGSGVPQTLPKDVLLIVIYREDSVDKIAFIEGSMAKSDRRTVGVNDIDTLFKGYVSVFDRTKTINVVVHNGKEKINAEIYLAATSWLAAHQLSYNFILE